MKNIFLLFVLISLNTFSQTPQLSPTFHQGRRAALREKMPEKSVAIFVSNPQQKRSLSSTYKFKQHTDLYYLSGINEPNIIMFIFKDYISFEGKTINELMFVSPKDPTKELWDGIMLGENGAKNISGLETVKSIRSFKDLSFIPEDFNKLFGQFPEFENTKDNQLMRSIIEKIKNNYTTLNPKQIQFWLDQLRGIKTNEELNMIKKAVQISGQGHIEAMKAIKTGISERQVQAVHEFTHRIMGAEDVGYLPIVGAGNNGCILHYHENNKENLNNRLILMDVGAEYGEYTGDITRTVPVNGKFNTEEKLLYQIVLEALEAGIKVAKNGNNFQDIDSACRMTINEGLVRIGLIKTGEKHNYFPHGVSHHLGLDVHDRGEYGKLQTGMIITVEPGIYIADNSPVDNKWWGIGIRIEDNVLITDNGNENLSAFVPKTIEDIEKIMGTSELVLKKNN